MLEANTGIWKYTSKVTLYFHVYILSTETERFGLYGIPGVCRLTINKRTGSTIDSFSKVKKNLNIIKHLYSTPVYVRRLEL